VENLYPQLPVSEREDTYKDLLELQEARSPQEFTRRLAVFTHKASMLCLPALYAYVNVLIMCGVLQWGQKSKQVLYLTRGRWLDADSWLSTWRLCDRMHAHNNIHTNNHVERFFHLLKYTIFQGVCCPCQLTTFPAHFSCMCVCQAR
jgi:hypothetical protein